MQRESWIVQRLESFFDNCIFAIFMAIVSLAVSVLKSIPLPLVIAISGGTFIIILILLRIVFWRVKENFGLYNVIPILHRMDERLRILAHKLPNELILNPDNVTDINQDGKTEANILGVKLTMPEIKEGEDPNMILKSILSTVLKEQEKNIPTKAEAKESIVPMLKQISEMFDALGNGLKPFREKDHSYLHLKGELDDYYDRYSNFIDDELNKLIKQHVAFSESLNNLIYQAPWLSKLGLISILPAEYKIELLVSLESDIDNAMKDKRIAVGTYIQLLESEKRKHNESIKT